MKRTIHSLILTLVAALLLAGCAATDDHAAEVARWRVLYSQEPSLEAVSRMTGWKNLTLPFMARLPYPPQRAIQYLWLAGEIDLEKPERYYGISLGRVYLADRVFVNGTLVGKRLPADVQELHYPRNYEIPPDILVPGRNTVHVYLGIYGNEYGGLADRVQFLSRDLFLKRTILMEFLYRQLTVGILVLFLAGIVYFLMELIWRRAEGRNIIVLMILAVWISYLTAIFSPYYPVNMDFRITLIWSCASLIPIFFFLFIQYYYRIFLSGLNMIYIPILAICAILTMINQDTTSPYYMGRVLGLFTVGISIPAHGYLFYYITRRSRPDITILYFILLGVLPAGVIVWDIVNAMFVYHHPPLYHIYALPAILALFVMLRIRENMKQRIRLEVLYGRLKYQIGDVLPVQDPKGPGGPSGADETAFTPAMEEKLRRVVDFCKAQYLSDISSDGLAMAMDLSPDEMSRIFKAYTGYPVADFIDKLRIEDAARKLQETDLRVIDIALSSGFESIITFNRAFSKIMDTTPGEYRKRHGPEGRDAM